MGWWQLSTILSFSASSSYIDYDNEAESDTTNVHLYLVDPDAEDTLSEG